MLNNTKKINRRGTWKGAVGAIVLPIALYLFVRLFVVEFFAIPSGSMIPTLLVRDYVVVTKFDYGLKVPLTRAWIWQWSLPQRGEVVVFRYPENEKMFFIKRVIGIPGDRIEISNGEIVINGESPLLVEEPSPIEVYFGDDEARYAREELDSGRHWVRFSDYPNLDLEPEQKWTVPPGHLFVMGDNRFHSRDSRYWGFLPVKNLLGRARWIVWSCGGSLGDRVVACDPLTLRRDRVFKTIE